MTGVRVADVAVARSVAAEIAADVRLAEASRSRQRADVTSVAAARPKHADPARTADLVKHARPARIVRRAVIVLRGPTVPPARIADRVKDARRARSAPRSEIALRAKSSPHPTIVGGAKRVLLSTIADLARNLQCSVIAARARIGAVTAADAMRAPLKPRCQGPHGIRAPLSRMLRSRVMSPRASMTAKAVAVGAGVVAAAVAGTVKSAGRFCRERRCLRFPQ